MGAIYVHHTDTDRRYALHGTPHGVFIDLMARFAALYFGR